MLDQLLDEIIEREGTKDTDNPNDAGGRTKYGISQRYHPDAWAHGPPTLEAAKQIYTTQYVIQPGFHTLPAGLMEQMVDFGVNSGPATAIGKLQTILNLTPDGVLGPLTIAGVRAADSKWINNQLVMARVRMLCRLAQKRPTDLEFLFGWVNRSFSFFEV